MVIAKANTPSEQLALVTTLHQFLRDGNRNLRDLNGDYKHFTALVVVPGTYMKKFIYGHRIRSAGIIQIYPVANKLLELFGKGGEGLGPAQAIVLPQTLWDISRVKNTTYGEIEMVFQSGTHNLESASMTTQNVSGDEDIMYIALILAHMVYGGFNQDISAELVHKILQVIQQ